MSYLTRTFFFPGKLTRLEIGNNSITAKGAFHVAEYVKKSKTLLSLNISMNDIGDEVVWLLVTSNNPKTHNFDF